MKTKYILKPTIASHVTTASGLNRFCICQETSDRIYAFVRRVDSDVEAVTAFMFQSPAFEGGEIRLIDQCDERMIACVKWRMETTELGLPILHRENIFLDWHLALIACQIQREQQLRDTVELTA